MRVTRHDTLDYCPGLPLIYHGLAELMEAGHCQSTHQLGGDAKDYRVLCGYCGSKEETLVGVYVFRVEDNAADIILGYVDIGYRNFGYGTQMWEEVVKWCRELKLTHIDSNHHVDNDAILRRLTKQGRVVRTVSSRYMLRGVHASSVNHVRALYALPQTWPALQNAEPSDHEPSELDDDGAWQCLSRT